MKREYVRKAWSILLFGALIMIYAAKNQDIETTEAIPDSPTRVIQKYTDELRSLLDLNDRKKKGVKNLEREQKIAEKVRQFFDFPGLAKLSLGRHWMKVTKDQQKEFQDLFINLVEDSYIRRSRDLMGNYNISYGDEKIQKNHAKVVCRVARDDADIDIVYELHRNPKNWMIFNIILDNVDLIKNYQSQFNRIIGKSGFNELLKLMRKKLGTTVEDADVSF